MASSATGVIEIDALSIFHERLGLRPPMGRGAAELSSAQTRPGKAKLPLLEVPALPSFCHSFGAASVTSARNGIGWRQVCNDFWVLADFTPPPVPVFVNGASVAVWE